MKSIEQGAVKSVVLVPQQNKREKIFGEVVSALKNGDFYVMRPKYSKNSIYVLLRQLKDKANIEAKFGVTDTEQFALYIPKPQSTAGQKPIEKQTK